MTVYCEASPSLTSFPIAEFDWLQVSSWTQNSDVSFAGPSSLNACHLIPVRTLALIGSISILCIHMIHVFD
jgi:hypothetical protein